MQVRFNFKNRSKVALAPLIDLNELREQLTAVAQMQFSDAIIAVFRSWGMFDPAFLIDLKNMRLHVPEVWVDATGDLQIESVGTWFQATLWEIYTLAIVSELYGRAMMKQQGISQEQIERECLRRLDEKIALFAQHPDFRLMQFGLRRRFSGRIEDLVTEQLKTKLPPGILTGASNVYVANTFNLEAQGTNAHELPMALVAYARHTSDTAVRDAPYEVLRKWRTLYGHKALIVLDDTFGSKQFRWYMPRDLAEDYRGFRHDSGEPYAYGNNTVTFYRERGINPTTKQLIFSDGLNARGAIDLHLHFRGSIMTGAGMGTHLTFDVGFPPPSLVMKLTEAAGRPAVKLSNNLAKATGDPREIQEIKRIFGYNVTEETAVTY